MPSARERELTLDEVVEKLVPAIGREKSHEAVNIAVQALGTFDAEAVLNRLAADPGVIGIAARFVRNSRSTSAESSRHGGAEPSRFSQRMDPNAMPADAGPVLKVKIHRRAVTELLAPSLGEDVSVERVSATLKQLGIDREELNLAEALRLLETLALAPGLVGITARFAKARLILLSRASSPPGQPSR